MLQLPVDGIQIFHRVPAFGTGHIHQVEHELYPRVLGWLAAGRVSVDAEGKVHLAE